MAIGLKSNINRIHCKSLRAISDKIIVHGMEFGGQTLNSGIILVDQVYSIGPQANTELKVGQYVMVAHGRWTRGINITDEEGDKTIRCVDPKDCLLVSDEPQANMAYGDKEGA
jgi:hypothetical protein